MAVWSNDGGFQDRSEAEDLAGFFFGEEKVKKVIEDDRGVTLPECTGVWSLSTRR
jgi:hypothetical protein